MSQKSTGKSAFFISPSRAVERRVLKQALTRARTRKSFSVPSRKTLPFGTRDPGFVDLAPTARNCDTTGSITLVATIAQGTTINQRIGKKAQYKSFQIRGHIFAGTMGSIVRGTYFLVYDKRPTGALPAITDILVTANSASFTNDANSNRFQIIHRMDYEILGDSTNLPQSDKTAYMINEFVKFKRPIGFKAVGTGAIADIEEGAVYLVTVGDQAAGTGAAISDIGIRTRFVDV